MVGKKYRWQAAWTRLPDGGLIHSSGLRVTVTRGDGYTDLSADPATLAAFQDFEAARGVPFHDIAARLQRLIREAEEWYRAHP